MADGGEWFWRGAGALGGALVTTLSPDLVPAAWKLPAVLFGLGLFATSLLPKLGAMCDWLLSKRGGRVTLIFIALMLAGASVYTGYRGFRGDRLFPRSESKSANADKQAHTSPATPAVSQLSSSQPSQRVNAPKESTEPETPHPASAAGPAIAPVKHQPDTAGLTAQQPHPLRRLITYQIPEIGIHADRNPNYFGVVVFQITNIAQDAVNLTLSHMRVYQNNNLKVNFSGSGKPTYLEPLRSSQISIELPPTAMSLEYKSFSTITLDFEFQYDTFEPSGTRRTGMVITYPYTWPTETDGTPHREQGVVESRLEE